MAQTAKALVDEVLPVAPYRQWTLSFPWRIRLMLLRDKKLLSQVLSIFQRVVFAYQRRRARLAGVRDPQCGSVTFCHRFDSLLRPSPHFHSFLPDGVFHEPEPGTLAFFKLPPPSDEDVQKLVLRIAERVERLVSFHEQTPDDEDQALDQVIAETAHAAAASRLLLSEGISASKPRCAAIDGYSLHADVYTPAENRELLEKLLRYGGRPPLAASRLSMTKDGKVRYKLRKRYHDGRTSLVMEPEAFVRKLAALIPPPFLNLTRFHGIFSPHAKKRPLLKGLVPPAKAVSDNHSLDHTAASAVTSLTDNAPEPVPVHVRSQWAELLRRTLGVDPLSCPDCGGKMRLIALIKEKPVIDQILTHLSLPTDFPPPAPARSPPQLEIDDFNID